MKTKIRRAVAELALTTALLLGGCSDCGEVPATSLRQIVLAGPAATPQAEISGLAWHRDDLLMLPQYPDRFAEGGGKLFFIPKAQILEYLAADEPPPIVPQETELMAPPLPEYIDGYEGFEALAFSGEDVYLTIEACTGGRMRAFLIRGTISEDSSRLVLDTSALADVMPRGEVPNASDEAIVLAPDAAFTIYEANGRRVNSSPSALVFDRALSPLGSIAFPHIEYRVTDATALDKEGNFWILNYFFPGDWEDYLPDFDNLSGEDSRDSLSRVERLIELHLGSNSISFTSRAPVELPLAEDGDSRNWEGLARLEDRGFLLATDRFPETQLAFVPLTE